MPTAVPELIALELVSRLEDITIANGYSFDVAAVVRPSRDGSNVKYQHLSLRVDQGAPTRNRDLDFPGNPPAVAYDLEFLVKGCVRGASSDPHATTENDLGAAIVKAIKSVGNDWYTFDGNAVIADTGDEEPFKPDQGELNGISVPVLVTYRVSENDPYTVRA